ncbi:hypothetical protein ABEX29_06625 [Brevibacillus porteri]
MIPLQRKPPICFRNVVLIQDEGNMALRRVCDSLNREQKEG